MKTKNQFYLILSLAMVVIFWPIAAFPAAPFPVPDTGQATCYDADGNVLDPCPAEGENFYGQDAQYTINPPSYIKLNASGQALDDDATDWVMVKDSLTGLIWEVKTDDGDIHDKDNRYNLAAALSFIAQLNTDQFGGYTDWRLPTRLELTYIVDYSYCDPAIDINYFPFTTYDFDWSSTPRPNDETTPSWQVEFFYGHDSFASPANTVSVRAVRGEAIGSASLVDNEDGTITDESTGLMWNKFTADLNDDTVIDTNDKMDWREALAWCESLDLAGHSDWRLPTIKELKSIVDSGTDAPAFDTTFFPDTVPDNFYWSSTTYASSKDVAWGILSMSGWSRWFDKSSSYYVRAVRDGQDENIPPTADAGEDRAVMEGTVAALDGSGSFDPDDGIETYAWEQTGGSAVTLSDETAAQPTFTVPAGILGQTLTFALTVTDYAGASDTDSVTLTVTEFACITLPDKPLLISPSDGAVNVSLTPTLQADAYNDPGACSTHFKTRWQISDQADFSGLTYNANTFGAALTSHQVTKMVLEPATTYYWRVRYWGDHGLKSEWSDVWTFTTASDNRDANGNGVPDDQESSPNTDINDNGTPDSEETSLRALLTADGTADIGLEFGKDILAIAVEAMSETEISGDLSGDFPYGLIGFRVNTATLGATVNFTVYMADRAPDSAFWYKYDNVNGWYDFTGQVTFSANRKSLSFTLTDGGTGDADGVVNGVIVDPAGLVVETVVPSGGGSGSGCFVETVTGF
ncbi:Lcl C-terminal domain-containing protein [Desulfosudis oleivorans]|uniref:Fibronectin type-III domain-containing protein n=1 Tax=Desulfosudis oleivorans (strain DSM 6200 / JCM 39069 / Hxd3) TaxID=96561 RepID=A9A0R2_DESOH|nr:DUF1566 domain-containing protein [Desulfosudis oleivorans]ABW67537.1 protein of unknown function DUF1566 [Desulfosudis oleivorans Hxd3]